MGLEVMIMVIPGWRGMGRIRKGHQLAFRGDGNIPFLHLIAGYMRMFMW